MNKMHRTCTGTWLYIVWVGNIVGGVNRGSDIHQTFEYLADVLDSILLGIKLTFYFKCAENQCKIYMYLYMSALELIH